MNRDFPNSSAKVEINLNYDLKKWFLFSELSNQPGTTSFSWKLLSGSQCVNNSIR